jgi:hypothetical protein
MMLQALGRQVLSAHRVHTSVHLASGEIIDVPFTSRFKTDPLFYTEQTPSLEFDTSLWLRIDENEQAMFQADGWKLDEQGKVEFGYLYLTIDFRPEEPGDFVAFRFVAATDGMSRLMEDSQSLYRAFRTLLAENGGICGILDREDYQEAILWWLKGQDLFRPLPEGIIPSEEEIHIPPHWNFDLWLERRFDGLVEGWLRKT